MPTVTNKFGTGTLHNIDSLQGKIYCTSAACMSVWADFLSWANRNVSKICRHYAQIGPQDSIIVLSCQVTDLAILNDLRVVEKLRHKRPNNAIYIGGCLAKRFDVDLPDGVFRLNDVRHDGQYIENTLLIDYEDPFWVPLYSKQHKRYTKVVQPGRLFRQRRWDDPKYPLRISVGCHGKCAYCTINQTRGTGYDVPIDVAMAEWKRAAQPNRYGDKPQHTIFIADSPSQMLVEYYSSMAMSLQRKVSWRNIEPNVAMQCSDLLVELAESGYLDTFHCPIQSLDNEMLLDMGRDPYPTHYVVDTLVPAMRANKVRCATNIIVDYKNFPNHWAEKVYGVYDYVSWNPYWDGVWDRDKAERRWRRYFGV